MKHIKKVFALLLAFAMTMGMATTVFADATGSTVTGHQFTYEGTDKTDDGKITMANATKDVTYSLYKIFDANFDGTNVAYTIKATDPAYGNLSADFFTVSTTADANGNYSVSRKGTWNNGTFTPAKTDAEIIAYIKTLIADTTINFPMIGAIKSDVNGSIVWDKIPYGYYYISPDQPTTDAVVTIDSNTPTVNVIDKNQTISLEKYILETDDQGDPYKTKVNEAGLTEDINYEITVNATNYNGVEKVYKYVVQDNIEAGMTFKAGTAPVIKVDGTEVPAANYTIKYYTDNTKTTAVTGSDLSTAQYFEIEIKWTDTGLWSGTHLYAANAKLTVEYTAFLDPNKREQLVIGGTNDGNTNTANVQWYSDIDTPTVEEPKGDLPDEKTDTFTTELTILKQDQDGKALEGAEFTLEGPQGAVVITKVDSYVLDASGEYWLLNDGTYTKQDPNGTIDGNPVDKTKYASETDKYAITTTYTVVGAGQTTTDIKVEVGTDGKATFTGLVAGEYTLKETKVPKGFNKIEDIKFTIGMTISDDSTSQTGKKVTFTSNNNLITVEADNTLMATIVNYKGTELPSTGGIGTTLFYIIGTMLVLGAGVVLVTKRRLDA